MDNENNMSGPSILWGEIEGKKVKSVDGENLGKIEKISQNHVMIEEGLVKKKRFWIPKFVADYYDGKSIWLDIKKEELKQRYYYDQEPESSQYDLDMNKYNTIYGKNKSNASNEKIKLKEGADVESKKGYKNIRDLK
ncbi:MAG TPA: hypothetical protein VJ697_15580 [Nitrososphaeraceae archaeon]|jgi:hypothetical protein|nr:hypothetical protein [Nitrososphaeraceae archaeon]